MRGFLGIDLGSTTTKAVVLAENGDILGRGLTNTRANFDVAAQVAREEALADARFTLVERALADDPATRATAAGTAARARKAYGRAERYALIARLRQRVDAAVSATQAKDTDQVRKAVAALFDALAKAAREIDDDQAFWGEAMLAQAAALAEPATVKHGVAYERVMGPFEKALAADENEAHVLPPEAALGELPSDAAKRAVEKALAEQIDIAGLGGTGYGRHRLPFGKTEVRSEILCHGLGAHKAFPKTRTVLDIGGQDTKAIQLDENGLVTSFQMNDRCAAGCGRYLGYVAEELGIGLGELAPIAMASSAPAKINSTCTVFAGAEIRERLALGEKREDVVAGLHRAIVQRAVSLLARSGGVSDQLTFSGGVAKNGAVVKFLHQAIGEHYGSVTVNIPKDSIHNGCIGAAMFAAIDARKRS